MKNIETSQRERVRSFPDLCVFFSLYSHTSGVHFLPSRRNLLAMCVRVCCVFFFLVLICRDVLGLNVLDVNNSTDWIRGKGNKANEWNENETKIWKTTERKHITGKGAKRGEKLPEKCCAMNSFCVHSSLSQTNAILNSNIPTSYSFFSTGRLVCYAFIAVAWDSVGTVSTSHRKLEELISFFCFFFFILPSFSVCWLFQTLRQFRVM